MNPEDISRFINGCDIQGIKGEDFMGHIGIVVMYIFFTNGPIDPSRIAREYKFDTDEVVSVCERLNQNGFFNLYNWPFKSKNYLLSVLKHKNKSCVRDWCQISAISSGYIGKE